MASNRCLKLKLLIKAVLLTLATIMPLPPIIMLDSQDPLEGISVFCYHEHVQLQEGTKTCLVYVGIAPPRENVPRLVKILVKGKIFRSS